VRVRIHRGTQEIGGTCIEVAADDGHRIVLDLGRPLTAGWDEAVPLPDVPGLAAPDPTLLALFISHPHLDHYGLASELTVEVPTYIGAEASRLLEAASYFSPVSGRLRCTGHLRDRQRIELGPFLVTPYLVDHSGFDAYALLIEADGQRVFYTGDLRGHGRKAKLFERLVADPPPAIDVLLTEGTHVRSDPTHDATRFPTESDLEQQFVDLAAITSGSIVTFGSAQNLDRLVTLYRAAKRSGRTLVVDLYGATVASATRASIPQPGFDQLRVYVPNRQRVRVKTSGEFHRVTEIAPHRIYLEEVLAEPGRYLFHVPSSTAGELLRAGVLDRDALAVWSMWDGYLAEPSGVRLQEALAAQEVPLVHVHTSGHASVPDLQRLAASVAPRRLVPVHSEAGDRFPELFTDVDRQQDGVWWQVA
jgi:ribonuclease J